MKSDGSTRRKLAGSGRPKWSPDGHRFLIVSLDPPYELVLIDDRPNHYSGKIGTPWLLSVPSWSDEFNIVAVTASESGKPGDTISLIDMGPVNPGNIKSTLCQIGNGLDIRPSDPVFSSTTYQCAFVIVEKNGMVLSIIDSPNTQGGRMLEKGPPDRLIQDLAFSPDGRFLIFASSRGEPAK